MCEALTSYQDWFCFEQGSGAGVAGSMGRRCQDLVGG